MFVFHFLFAVPPMEIFPGGSGLSPSKEVNKGEIIITGEADWYEYGAHASYRNESEFHAKRPIRL